MIIMELIGFFSNCSWKLKAIKCAKELNSLKKRNKELIISRDKIKKKNDNLRIKINELEVGVTKLKNELKKN